MLYRYFQLPNDQPFHRTFELVIANQLVSLFSPIIFNYYKLFNNMLFYIENVISYLNRRPVRDICL